MSLYQLPSGDWCDPATIKAVRALDGHYCDILKKQFHPRVVVEYGSGGTAICHYESFDAACLARDEVAGHVISREMRRGSEERKAGRDEQQDFQGRNIR